MRKFVRCFVGILFLSFALISCGGGGGGTASTTNRPMVAPSGHLSFPFGEWSCVTNCDIGVQSSITHYDTSRISQTRFDAKHSPVYHDSDKIFVGVDQGTEHVRNLRVTGERGNTQIRFGFLNDGVGRQKIENYIYSVTGNIVEKYEEAPEIRIIGSSNPREQDVVTAAVRLVNTSLPESAKISIGTPLPDMSLQNNVSPNGRYFRSGQEKHNTIHVEFTSSYWDIGGNSAGITFNNRIGNEVVSSYIQLNKHAGIFVGDTTTRRAVILVAHEIMHTLVDYLDGGGHVPSGEFDSLLVSNGADIYNLEQDGTKQPRSLLYPVDREVLRVLYSRLDNGDSPTSLGPWESTSTHIHGNAPHVGFGVAFRNGYAEPYAHGYFSDRPLSANNALSGNVTWDGEILGFTPSAEVVAGDAEINVELRTLTGNADFTELEKWQPRTQPGEAGGQVL